MTTTQELAAILAEIDRPGDCFVSGRTEFLVPRIEVNGVGPLALSLIPVQAKQLIKTATRAPFGRGNLSQPHELREGKRKRKNDGS